MDQKSAKILVVDDNKSNRTSVLVGLDDQGFIFEEAQDGAEALTKIKNFVPDLIIMDVEMPRMGGYDVCRICKNNKLWAFIPIILMTAREGTDNKIEGLEVGADDYLIKPVNMLELKARVNSMLRMKRLQDDLLKTNEKLKEAYEKVNKMAIEDELMGIYNRRYFFNRLEYEFDRYLRYQVPLSVLMIDIDHFKNINDTYGHPMGDFVLKKTAKVFEEQLRATDILARYGGEEIAILLPQTEKAEAMMVGEKLRNAMESTTFSDKDMSLNATISVGISSIPLVAIENADEFMKMADDAVYYSKKNGRNKVTHFTDFE